MMSLSRTPTMCMLCTQHTTKHARSYGGRQHTVDETCVCIGHEAVSACVTA